MKKDLRIHTKVHFIVPLCVSLNTFLYFLVCLTCALSQIMSLAVAASVQKEWPSGKKLATIIIEMWEVSNSIPASCKPSRKEEGFTQWIS